MPEYDINIKRLLKESETGNIKTEIWAEITNRNTCETINRRIWWVIATGVDLLLGNNSIPLIVSIIGLALIITAMALRKRARKR
jgi:hypothetical protein